MERIILIETSTALCSVALTEGGAVTAYRESSAPKAHASLTAVFVQEVLAERSMTLADCDAVCVSMGPGSYTGLRVGVSTAKGLCFGSGKPLLAVGTLDTLVAQALSGSTSVSCPDQDGLEVKTPERYSYIIPMIDARRMEVYSAVFRPVFTSRGNEFLSETPEMLSGISVIPDGVSVIPSEVEGSAGYIKVTETTPVIVDSDSFAEYLEQGPCLFIGDGAGKCADVLTHPNAHFCQCHPKASSMLLPALNAFRNEDFKDVAYFEPFYLKEFVATVSKKKLL